MNPMIECLHDEEVGRLLTGEVDEARTFELEQHLTNCIDCRQRLVQQVGDDGWWNETETSLRSQHAATLVAASLRDAGNCRVEDCNAEDCRLEAMDADDASLGETRLRGTSLRAKILDLLGPTDDPNMLGRIGPYEIIGLLGQGGMGAVFKGFDRSLNRFVAIKMLLPHLAASGAARKRFAREGQAVAAVVDDHVMAIHCVDEWQGVPYLVMTYSRGVSLQKRLGDNGPLDVREILRIGMQAAKGLAAAHAQGIVHRDIKPANIFLDQNVERVQLMDFGLARAVDDASLTRSGVLAGTPQYMSPEQARAETVDHRSDLFSLGSVMYAMCSGHAPFRAESSYGVLRLITDKEPRSIREINPDIPVWLCAIIGKLIAKQASERFDSAQEVAELLAKCLAHIQQPATVELPESVAALLPSPSERIRVPSIVKWIASAMLSFLLIFAGVLIVLEWNKGTLTIVSDVEDVPIRIMQGKDVVERLTLTKSPQKLRIAAGNYIVEVDGDFPDVAINNGTVTLGRCDTVKVEVSEQGDISNPASPQQPSSSQERSVMILDCNQPSVDAPGVGVGDRVDVYVTFLSRDGNQFMATRLLVENLEVVAKLEASSSSEAESKGRIRLLVTADQGAKLQYANARGGLDVRPRQANAQVLHSDGINHETLAEMQRSFEPAQFVPQRPGSSTVQSELDGDWVLEAYIKSDGTALKLEWADAPHLRIRGNEIGFDQGRNPSRMEFDLQNKTLTYQKDSEKTPSTYRFERKGKQLTLRTENDSVLHYSRNSTAHIEDKSPTELESPWYLESVVGKPNAFVAETRTFRGNRCELRSADGQQIRQGEVDPFEKWMLTYSKDAGGPKFETNETYELLGDELTFVDKHSNCVYRYRKGLRPAPSAPTELEGEWHLESLQVIDGTKVEFRAEIRVIRGNRLTCFFADGESKHRIEVDSIKKQIKVFNVDESAFIPERYELNGDRLTIYNYGGLYVSVYAKGLSPLSKGLDALPQERKALWRSAIVDGELLAITLPHKRDVITAIPASQFGAFLGKSEKLSENSSTNENISSLNTRKWSGIVPLYAGEVNEQYRIGHGMIVSGNSDIIAYLPNESDLAAKSIVGEIEGERVELEFAEPSVRTTGNGMYCFRPKQERAAPNFLELCKGEPQNGDELFIGDTFTKATLVAGGDRVEGNSSDYGICNEHFVYMWRVVVQHRTEIDKTESTSTDPRISVGTPIFSAEGQLRGITLTEESSILVVSVSELKAIFPKTLNAQ